MNLIIDSSIKTDHTLMNKTSHLQKVDPELSHLLESEYKRQVHGIELIASENFTSQAVLDCLGSCLTNKYSEGQPLERYYGGNEYVDQIELLCKKRCLNAFHLDSEEWDVNVQPYSGSPANFAVYTAFLQPHDRLMGLDLPSGGHLTHGFYTAKKKISATSIFFESLPYKVNEKTGLIDFEELKKLAQTYRPKLIVCGASSYPRTIEFDKFREIADSCDALLMADMAHISGLVAGGAHLSPFPFCDIVTTTTHKTLRGPRCGAIFTNIKKLGKDAKTKVDQAVFPGLQGGPHNHQIAALACQLREVADPEWSIYAHQIVANSKALANRLMEKNQILVTGGTDNHLCVWDLRPLSLTGSKLEKLTEAVGISLSKNTVPGDSSALNPSGVRIGTPAMTTRGCKESDVIVIADILLKCATLCQKIQKISGKKLVDFLAEMKNFDTDLDILRNEVKSFALRFPFPSQ